MIINYLEDHLELEEKGHINQVLVAVRYTGPKSSLPASKFNRPAAWPAFSPLQGGPKKSDGSREPGSPQAALVPDWTDEDTENRGVEALESDPDIEVYYSREEIAKCMLDSNYLDPNVFGRGFDAEVRDFVFDKLGLEDVGVRNESEYRAQLREIAGVEGPGEGDNPEVIDDARATEYRQEHTRAELKTAATILGKEQTEVGKIDLADWLAEQDAAAVRFAFEGKPGAAREAAGLAAGDDDQPASAYTPADVIDDYEHEEIKTVVKKVREGAGEISLRGASNEDMAAFLVERKELSEDEIDAHLTE